jgi:hypothetical protein
MSDEIKTEEQALAEVVKAATEVGLPEVIEGAKMGAVASEPIQEEPVFEDSAIVDRAPFNAVAEHVKGSISIADIAKEVLPKYEVVVAAKSKKNLLDTQDFCPLKEYCNHPSADHCKQAKLEADHRLNCIKGNKCDCFHPARGIPSIFRVGGGGDGRVS